MKRFFVRSSWSRPDCAALFIVLALVVWFATPSRLFFNPEEVHIDGYEVTLARTYPVSFLFGPPVVSYTETVRRLDGSGQICDDNNGAGYQYVTEGPIGRWDIEDWAKDCMIAPYLWRAEWQVKVFGLIPLRPVSLSLLVEPD